MQWVGVDVGGTFTDVVVYDEAGGTLDVGKSPTSPADPTVGLLNALTKLKVDLAGTGRVVHGTTIGTNAVLERTGAPVWLLTTRGFRDTLEIGRTNRTILYDMRAQKPAPLVPRTRVVEIDERVTFDGTVLRPLREDDVRAALARVRESANGARAALVVSFLHSYAWPAHEDTAARIAAEMLPGWFISTSADVLPELREYERCSTAALNAYIGPKVGGYLTALTRALADRDYRGKVFITTSSGGIVPAEVAARYPVHTVLSGPAGGVAAAVNLGRLTGQRNLITYDMGGTSTDVCLIEDLEPALTTEQHIAGLPNRTPQIEINSIGAGGGSVAWLDAGGALRVGPRSAGADPGPACYGRGGVEATITDANVVLGRAGTDVPLAGEIELDAERARQALARLGAGLPEVGDVAALADGVVRLAVARMVSAIKEISIARGHDPRDFALVAYGGAGPMHAALLADELDMTRVIVPPAPGNFSAFGSLISDLRRDYVRTRLLRTRGGGDAAVERLYAGLEREARADLGAEGVAPSAITLVRMLGMRYVGQSWELLVRWPDEMSDGTLAALEAAFHRAHEQRYGHATAREAEVVSLRLTAVGAVAKPTPPRWTVTGTPAQAERVRREVSFDRERQRVAVYRRERLPGGTPLSGPAIIEEMGATTVIPPGWSATVGPWGELVLTRQSP
ncbi:MAG: hydantoinase/oxoprolinase family protein [Candidatus Rokubacteria bacterium]|nr:hydantoinase/oxoprolinase family protein [Candidatus Rokubacteria bacterium]